MRQRHGVCVRACVRACVRTRVLANEIWREENKDWGEREASGQTEKQAGRKTDRKWKLELLKPCYDGFETLIFLRILSLRCAHLPYEFGMAGFHLSNHIGVSHSTSFLQPLLSYSTWLELRTFLKMPAAQNQKESWSRVDSWKAFRQSACGMSPQTPRIYLLAQGGHLPWHSRRFL